MVSVQGRLDEQAGECEAKGACTVVHSQILQISQDPSQPSLSA